MPTFRITVSNKGLTQKALEKLLKPIRDKLGEDADLSIEKVKHPETRRERFDDALSQIESGKAELESLQEELESWVNGMPENLQNGSKAEEINMAISGLEDLVGDLNNVCEGDVEFPGMR